MSMVQAGEESTYPADYVGYGLNADTSHLVATVCLGLFASRARLQQA